MRGVVSDYLRGRAQYHRGIRRDQRPGTRRWLRPGDPGPHAARYQSDGEALEEGIAPDPASYHRAIVAAHRGTVGLRNRPPGCEITIELPRAVSGAEIRG
ncbi:hypothetical protein V7R84_06845 [Arachnia propionica]|uniref:hypothetical protein n=1 Tax=Arachnia propionica TaxID=1750 RepID=UPI0030CDF9FD